MNFDDPNLCDFGTNDPTSLGWGVNQGYVPYSWQGHDFPQGVYEGTGPLWDDLLDALVPTISGGLHPGWNWGAENRDNVNSPGTPSFHACGRALDVNAPANPNNAGWQTGAYAVPGSAAALARSKGFLCGGEWGDAMHFELHLTRAGIAARLAELGHHETPGGPGGPVHPGRAPFPLPAGYYFGPLSGPAQSISGTSSTEGAALSAHRSEIAEIQHALNAAHPPTELAIDGQYGPHTIGAVEWFQSHHGLTVDGLTGPATWAALGL